MPPNTPFPCRAGPLTAILDVGQTRTRLVVLDPLGEGVHQDECRLAPVRAGDCLALDTDGLADWLPQALADLGPLRAALASLCVIARGEALAAVDGERLVMPVADGAVDWLQRHGHGDFLRARLMPCAQYWSWWLSGVASSEVTSLGGQSPLWQPGLGDFSVLARQRGWAGQFAPLRRAWEVLGPVRVPLATRLGLPASLQVHVGAHASGAALARHLRASPRMTLVRTGDWCVVMAPGAPNRPLDAQRDLFSGVSVRQERVPTGRFPGGHEWRWLCGPAAVQAPASAEALHTVLEDGLLVLPGFGARGGPFRDRPGEVIDRHGQRVDLDTLDPARRAALAALYVAQITAWLIGRLGGTGPVVVEGPLAQHPVYTGVLAALLPGDAVWLDTDVLDGSVRGAWELTRWTDPQVHPPSMRPVHAVADAERLQHLQRRWCHLLGEGVQADLDIGADADPMA
jgi:sugar (pentulose or hexulose) kinase